MGKDKALHFMVCFSIVIIGALLFKCCGIEIGRAVAISSLTAFVVAIGKECYDKFVKKTYISIYDLVADMIGIISAVGTILLL